ncbi:hypothetical protein GCM10029978_065780 [Actinoallomurus acanthiterrae]
MIIRDLDRAPRNPRTPTALSRAEVAGLRRLQLSQSVSVVSRSGTTDTQRKGTVMSNVLDQHEPQVLRLVDRRVVVSSGAAINDSPVGGRYAGSKVTQQLIAGYALDEARRAERDIAVMAEMPRTTPPADMGRRRSSAVGDARPPGRRSAPEAVGGTIAPRDGRRSRNGVRQGAEDIEIAVQKAGRVVTVLSEPAGHEAL